MRKITNLGPIIKGRRGLEGWVLSRGVRGVQPWALERAKATLARPHRPRYEVVKLHPNCCGIWLEIVLNGGVYWDLASMLKVVGR